jgi:hypothetical protein
MKSDNESILKTSGSRNHRKQPLILGKKASKEVPFEIEARIIIGFGVPKYR